VQPICWLTLSSVGASLAGPCFRLHTPLIEPDVRICRMKCCRQHLMRNVAKSKMWPSGFKPLVLVVSRSAQRSLTLRPACSPDHLCDLPHQRLQQLRCLHRCSDCFRMERTSFRAGLTPAVDHHLLTAHTVCRLMAQLAENVVRISFCSASFLECCLPVEHHAEGRRRRRGFCCG
jgi:hypothetical protein